MIVGYNWFLSDKTQDKKFKHWLDDRPADLWIKETPHSEIWLIAVDVTPQEYTALALMFGSRVAEIQSSEFRYHSPLDRSALGEVEHITDLMLQRPAPKI